MRSVALLCITPFTHPTESWCSYVCRKGCYSAEDYRRLPHQRLRLVGHTRECGWSPWWWLTQSFDTRESSGIANQSSHYALTSPLMDLWSGFSFRPWQWAAIACSCSVLILCLEEAYTLSNKGTCLEDAMESILSILCSPRERWWVRRYVDKSLIARSYGGGCINNCKYFRLVSDYVTDFLIQGWGTDKRVPVIHCLLFDYVMFTLCYLRLVHLLTM